MQDKKDIRSEKFKMIKQWQKSGLTQKAFCEANNIVYHSFHYWYKAFKDDPIAGNTFLPVKVIQPHTPEIITLRSNSGIEMQLPLTDRSISFVKALLS